MGYLVDQMEKLAKESERSLGDKLALGAGTGAAYAGANTGMKLLAARELGKEMLQRDIAGHVGPKLIGNPSATVTGLQGFRNSAQALKNLTNRYMDEGMSLGKATGKATTQMWKAMPKKVKLLSALGLPVSLAAGYGGYKATDAMLGE
jgi:hypothetical protein